VDFLSQVKGSYSVELLKLLLYANYPYSGYKLAKHLMCSLAMLVRLVENLRGQGFIIKTYCNNRYLLMKESVEFLSVRVEARLSYDSLGMPFVKLSEIDSTNLEIHRRAKAGLVHGACLATDFQKAGRGRLGRCWLAPRATCLLFSLFLRPSIILAEIFILTNLAAISVCRAVEKISNLNPQIKWPNDIFLNDMKLAGILTEVNYQFGRLEYVVVGIGVNVNLNITELASLSVPAISLCVKMGRFLDRTLLMVAILKEIENLYMLVLTGQYGELIAEYSTRSYLYGRLVQVCDGRQVFDGFIYGIDNNGALLLDQKNQIKTICYGDVSIINVK